MKKKSSHTIAFIVGSLLILSGSLYWGQSYRIPQLMGDAIWCVDTSEKVIALTFDDGPDAVHTHQILDLLNRYSAKATFFFIGENIEEYPGIVKETYRNGHDIGNHSWDHSRLTYRSVGFIEQQIQETDRVIRESGYQGKIYFRAPYGKKLFLLPYILKKMNRYHILWSISPRDWEGTSAQSMLNIVDRKISGGDILLLHEDSGDETIRLVEMILQKYTQKGYHFVTISDLMSLRQ